MAQFVVELHLPKPQPIRHPIQLLLGDISTSTLCLNPATSAASLLKQYDTTLSTLLDMHAPVLTRTITIRPNVPWFNGDIKMAKQREGNWREDGESHGSQFTVTSSKNTDVSSINALPPLNMQITLQKSQKQHVTLSSYTMLWTPCWSNQNLACLTAVQWTNLPANSVHSSRIKFEWSRITKRSMPNPTTCQRIIQTRWTIKCAFSCLQQKTK